MSNETMKDGERAALTEAQSSAIDAVCAKLTPTQALDLGDHIGALRSIQWQARAASQATVKGDEQQEPFPYQKTFNAIAAATTAYGSGHVGISVIKFREAFGEARAAAPQAGALTDEQRGVIGLLIDLARVTHRALDDSEEGTGDDGRFHAIDGTNFDAVSNVFDKLEELPDDKPGYTLDAAGKAEWALRDVLAAAQGGNRG